MKKCECADEAKKYSNIRNKGFCEECFDAELEEYFEHNCEHGCSCPICAIMEEEFNEEIEEAKDDDRRCVKCYRLKPAGNKIWCSQECRTRQKN
jgi:hypothetical protein